LRGITEAHCDGFQPIPHPLRGLNSILFHSRRAARNNSFSRVRQVFTEDSAIATLRVLDYACYLATGGIQVLWLIFWKKPPAMAAA
jgi:hypothetical protein